MTTWFWILFAVLTLVTLLSQVYFYKQCRHVVSRHIHILGNENLDVVKTLKLRLFLLLYVLVLPLLLLFFFLYFWFVLPS
jgi:hypothetical protein